MNTCDDANANATLAWLRYGERRGRRSGPGFFSGERAGRFTVRGSHGQRLRTCSYGRPLYESYILKTQEKVAPIFFLRARRTGWMTRRAQYGQDKARRQQEMESMSTILFLDLKLAICREARILRHELTNFEFEAQIWATVRGRCSLQDTRQRALVGHRQGEGNDFVFRFCGIRKVDGSIFFCSNCCWIFTDKQYVQKIGEKLHSDSVWWGYLFENHRNSVVL